MLADYRRLKTLIQKNSESTVRDGDAVILRDAIVREAADGGIRLREKIRGGQVVWDATSHGQPLTRVDDDPETFDRISIERVTEGDLVDRASIIYVERLMENEGQAELLQVLERWERYQRAGERGERFTRVNCKSMEILADIFTPDEEVR